MKRSVAFALLLSLFLCITAFAQNDDDSDPGNPPFTQQELDQMLAPVALYPDALLAQLLMAATYPLEVVEAARWTRANPSLRGDAAVQAVSDKNWDPSVQSLVAFPELLQTMDQKIEWTERLGDAFLAQSAQVMDTVQELRRKARAAGTLASETQLAIQEDDAGDITIEAREPDVVYVPYYDPAIAYGSWWWPEYPPVFWSPWPGYAWNGSFAWGFGIGIGVDFFFGGWDWHHHRPWVNDRRHRFFPRQDTLPGQQPWRHDRDHRHNIPYRNETTDRQFPRPIPLRAYAPYRGREVQPRPQALPPTATRPVTPTAPPSRVPMPTAPVQRPVPQSVRPIAPPQRTAPPVLVQPTVGARPNAFEGIGQGRDVRESSARGHASQPSPPPNPNPPGRKR